MKISNNYNFIYANNKPKITQQRSFQPSGAFTPSFKSNPTTNANLIKKIFFNLFKHTNKIDTSNLEKKTHIEFNKAKTIWGAKKFAKENFGIKEFINVGIFDVKYINWINEGFTNAFNKFNGELKFPTKIEIEIETSCPTLKASVSSDGSTLMINKHYYKLLKHKKDTIIYDHYHFNVLSPQYINNEELKILSSEKKNFNKLTFPEQLNVVQKLEVINDYQFNYETNVFNMIKELLKHPPKNKQAKQVLEKIDLDKIKKISKNKQIKYLLALRKKLGTSIKHNIMPVSPFEVIYHELGHVQDSKRGQRPVIKKFSAVRSKWEKTGAKVSEYACTGTGEYIAEVFAKILSGKNYPEEVMHLYKMFKGPDLPKSIKIDKTMSK